MVKKNGIDMDPDKIDALVIDTIKYHCADTIYFKDRESRFVWNSQQHADQFGVKSKTRSDRPASPFSISRRSGREQTERHATS